MMHRFLMLAWLVVTMLPASLSAQAPREFRAFAVAWKHELAELDSHADFRTAVRAQFEADIAQHLRTDAPNLVSYPENQTLMAYMIGPRGAASRAILDETGAIPALAGLAVPYAPQIAYYQARFPGTTAPGQLLQLALTDTLARLLEVFAELAAEHGVYVAVSSNLAAFERIEGLEAALLADPAAGAGYAYRATGPTIFNRNFVYGPDGRLVTIQDKAYLVPIEREQTLGLGLTGIQTWQLPVFDLPFARIATVISKDAWMIDVNDRLDQLGAELLIQPEAFSSWGVAGGDLWPPDKFQRGGWWMTQKQPAFAVNITPMLTGNLGDLSFDGQALIAVKGLGQPELCLMGQEPEFGWAAVGRWSDLTQAAAALCDPALRPALAEQGAAIAPGSGDARENRYARDVVFADLTLPPLVAPARRLPAAKTPSQTLNTGPAVLTPRLSADSGRIWLSWIDSFGEPNQNLAVARWQGEGWGERRRPAPTRPTAFDHFDNQWAPMCSRGAWTVPNRPCSPLAWMTPRPMRACCARGAIPARACCSSPTAGFWPFGATCAGPGSSRRSATRCPTMAGPAGRSASGPMTAHWTSKRSSSTAAIRAKPVARPLPTPWPWMTAAG